MFGKLRLHKGRVDEEQRRAYRAHFCGACHSLRSFGGRTASCLTNYDQTLWVVVAAALAERDAGAGAGAIELRPCTVAPWRRVPVRVLAPELAEAAAAVDLGVVGAKLEDDALDDSRLRSRGLSLLFGRRIRAAAATLERQGFPVAKLHRLPRRQQELERAGARPDALEAPSAGLSAALFVHAGRLAGAATHALAELARFGAALGAAVYWLDALEDEAEDRRRGSFNPIDGVALDRRGVRERALAAVGAARAAWSAVGELVALQDDANAIVLGVVDSTASRICGVDRAAVPVRQAGDCDCGVCECISCDACGCCGEGAGTAVASGGEASYCCCDACCCCRDVRADAKRRKRNEPQSPYGMKWKRVAAGPRP